MARNETESRDAARTSGGTESTSERLTILDPWQLDLPQEILDHYEQTSALTGIPPAQLVASTIKQQFAASESVKKKCRVNRVRRLIASGETFRRTARLTKIHVSSCYRWAADLTNRPRKPLTDSERRNILQSLQERENRSLRELKQEFGRDTTVIAALRRQALPMESGTVRAHRCSGCGAMINASVCLRCQLAARN